MPPQETGLTCNSWYGKFHLEMHYWHAAHFATWGRPALLERSLGWYDAILPSAREKARQQGYAGARWPKMTAPDGRDSPSPIGPLLIWQQPHPIAMAEMIYAAHPTRDTLARYRDIVFESAEFMASYAHYDPKSARYVLGPPVIPAQENHPPRETWNPTFELEYWDHALGIAQRWRERAGLAREPKWDDVRAKLSALPVKDGVYLAHENCPQTFTERNRDHPSMLGALGVLPGRKVDRETMRRTLKKVFAEWKWADTWGWDFPMVAMTAASLNEPALAIDALSMETPKNTWLPNGHNWQRANLPLYLPGNGGLLLAIAHMVRRKCFPQELERAPRRLSARPCDLSHCPCASPLLAFESWEEAMKKLRSVLLSSWCYLSAFWDGSGPGFIRRCRRFRTRSWLRMEPWSSPVAISGAARMSGSHSAGWRSAPSGDTAVIWPRTGPPTGCIAKPPSS